MKNTLKLAKQNVSIHKEKSLVGNSNKKHAFGIVQITKNTKPWNLIQMRSFSLTPPFDTKMEMQSMRGNDNNQNISKSTSPTCNNTKKLYNVILDMEPSKYLKDLYENCPNFEENVPIYGQPKSNWDMMMNFIMNKSSEEVNRKFQIARKYVEKKDSKDSIVRLMAMSIVNKGEIADRESHFPFHF